MFCKTAIVNSQISLKSPFLQNQAQIIFKYQFIHYKETTKTLIQIDFLNYIFYKLV